MQLSLQTRTTPARLRSFTAPLLASLACFALCFWAAAYWRDSFDLPLERAFGRLVALRSVPKDLVFEGLRLDLLQGPLLMAAVWLAWFGTAEREIRARIVLGVAAASVAGVASRILQLILPTHPRPLHDPALAYVPPPRIDRELLNHWNSFPSDHASLLIGLAAVVCLARPRLGAIALAWAFVINFNRVYEGLHFPTDILGGAALGVAVVCLSQTARLLRVGRALVRGFDNAPGVFVGMAFLVSFEVATLFEDVREAASGLARMLAGH